MRAGSPEKMRMVRVPERKLFSAPSGGFGVTEREGMGVTEREAEPFSFVSFEDSGDESQRVWGRGDEGGDRLFTPSFQDMVGGRERDEPGLSQEWQRTAEEREKARMQASARGVLRSILAVILSPAACARNRPLAFPLLRPFTLSHLSARPRQHTRPMSQAPLAGGLGPHSSSVLSLTTATIVQPKLDIYRSRFGGGSPNFSAAL